MCCVSASKLLCVVFILGEQSSSRALLGLEMKMTYVSYCNDALSNASYEWTWLAENDRTDKKDCVSEASVRSSYSCVDRNSH
jgi:hypothetical protein